MTLTREQRARICEAMIDATGDYIQMLAAGMRELAEIYRSEAALAEQKFQWAQSWNMENKIKRLADCIDDLEAK